MKIAILGTGGVGKAYATRLTELGHEVTVGTRDVNNTLVKDGSDGFKSYLEKNPRVKLATFAGADAFGEVVINVSKGEHTLAVVQAAEKDNLKGKVLIDISNPLDFSKGMPPSLIPEYSNTNSLGEEIQRRFPETFVVKT